MLSVDELKRIAYVTTHGTCNSKTKLPHDGQASRRTSLSKETLQECTAFVRVVRQERRPRRHGQLECTAPSPCVSMLPPINANRDVHVLVGFDEDELDGGQCDLEKQARRTDDSTMLSLSDRKVAKRGRKEKKQSPFLNYQEMESRLQNERRWLLQDSEHVALRKRGLLLNSVHERLVRSASMPEGGFNKPATASPTGAASSLGSKTSGLLLGLGALEQATAKGSTSENRRREWGQLTVLKSLQKDMQESAARMQKAVVDGDLP
mmetsp:Transcript_170688/g.547504  ORF Transcript_170688/g.547504 Transcript_170688/m.547504 type:complete len:264 (-) Transcript_170688:210-1001(-)